MQGMLKNWASRTLAKIIYVSGIINKRVSPKKGDLELRESLSLKKKGFNYYSLFISTLF